MMYQKLVKPLADILTAWVALVLLFPLLLVIALLLAAANAGNPFFFQMRPGKNGKIFRIVKFRTMNDLRDASGKLLPDAERLTAVGTFVRKTSLDELPQLFNVALGQMSFVGPRPLLTHYLHLYNEFQNRRHEVKPGITGWAQVNGRNAISWDAKFAYDVWYVDHISFMLDIRILLLTVKKVVVREGINAADAATIEPFNGS